MRKITFLLAWPFLLLSCSHVPQQPAPTPSDRFRFEATSSRYVIATQGDASSRAGRKMFELGGNAIDAVAAVSMAISVERPQSTGLGGGGFMMIYLAREKKMLAVDFREKAPGKAREKLFQDAKGNVIPDLSTDGILAGAVPGLVAGVLEIHRRYGKLSREEILKPAIELAEKGFPVYGYLAKAIAEQKDVLAKFPASAKIFLKSNGEPLVEGDLLVQKDLAQTLKEISKRGRAGFYKGKVARALIAEEKRLHGLITQKDLDAYQPVFREPLRGSFHGYDLYAMPLPSSGGVHVIQILNMLENDPLKAWGSGSAHAIHLTAAVEQQAFADRAKYLGDSDFVKVPVKGLLSKKYAVELRSRISLEKARPSQEVSHGDPWAHESDDTTHFSILDAEGNTVASTQTINGWMGSGVVIPGTGVLLNNEMDDFSAKPGVPNLFGAIGGAENAIAPHKRPLSSMSPTIVLRDGAPVLALGSPAGTRIISCVAETLLNVLEYGMPLYDAVASPRFHHQWTPDAIQIEPDRFPKATLEALEKKGNKITPKEILCRVQAVGRSNGELIGVADPRGPEDLAIGGGW